MLVFITPVDEAVLDPKGVEFHGKSHEVDFTTYEHKKVWTEVDEESDSEPELLCGCIPLHSSRMPRSPRPTSLPSTVKILDAVPERVIIHCMCHSNRMLFPGYSRVCQGSRFGMIEVEQRNEWDTTLIVQHQFQYAFDLTRFNSVIVCEFYGPPVVIPNKKTA